MATQFYINMCCVIKYENRLNILTEPCCPHAGENGSIVKHAMSEDFKAKDESIEGNQPVISMKVILQGQVHIQSQFVWRVLNESFSVSTHFEHCIQSDVFVSLPSFNLSHKNPRVSYNKENLKQIKLTPPELWLIKKMILIEIIH